MRRTQSRKAPGIRKHIVPDQERPKRRPFFNVAARLNRVAAVETRQHSALAVQFIHRWGVRRRLVSLPACSHPSASERAARAIVSAPVLAFVSIHNGGIRLNRSNGRTSRPVGWRWWGSPFDPFETVASDTFTSVLSAAAVHLVWSCSMACVSSLCFAIVPESRLRITRRHMGQVSRLALGVSGASFAPSQSRSDFQFFHAMKNHWDLATERPRHRPKRTHGFFWAGHGRVP